MFKGLEKPQQLAERVGVPVTSIRYLIRTNQLDHVYTTPAKRNPKVPNGAWERFIERSTVTGSHEGPTHTNLSSSCPNENQ